MLEKNASNLITPQISSKIKTFNFQVNIFLKFKTENFTAIGINCILRNL